MKNSKAIVFEVAVMGKGKSIGFRTASFVSEDSSVVNALKSLRTIVSSTLLTTKKSADRIMARMITVSSGMITPNFGGIGADADYVVRVIPIMNHNGEYSGKWDMDVRIPTRGFAARPIFENTETIARFTFPDEVTEFYAWLNDGIGSVSSEQLDDLERIVAEAKSILKRHGR